MTARPAPHPLADAQDLSLEVGDGLLLATGDVLRVLNGSAALIWPLLQTAGPAAAARLLARSYDIPLGRAEADIDALLALLAVPPLAPEHAVPDDLPPPPAPDWLRLPFRCGARRAELRLGPGLDPALFTPLLGPLAHEGDAPDWVLSFAQAGPDCHVWLDGAPRGRGTLDDAITILTQEICIEACEDGGARLALHAGSLVRDGRALLMPALSGSGKSTLSAGLAAAGWGYVGDELAPVLGPEPRLSPAPSPFTIKAGSWPVLTPRLPGFAGLPDFARNGRRTRYWWPPEAWRADCGRDWPVALLVFPRWVKDAPARPERLEPAEAAGLLVANDMWLKRPIDMDQLRLIRTLATDLPCWRMEFGDLDQAIAVITGLFDAL